MARDILTGSRIRERRQMAGLRQAELARLVGISASYINLIEHNRRRIGGKLLLDIARVLKVDPTLLTEGAEAALVSALRAAAAESGTALPELDRTEEFAGRFAGWAETLVRQQQRIRSLEQAVGTLSDRFNHDPQLAAALHELLSTATAIRSTAAILAETGDLTAQWRDRFHRNLDEDSRRLAQSSKALVAYLDMHRVEDASHAVPQEEAEAFLAAHGAHFPELEAEAGAVPGDPEQMAAQGEGLSSGAARQITAEILRQYVADAAAMPLTEVARVLAREGRDPLALMARFGVSLAVVLRRLAAMPPEAVGGEVGLVICDASGSIVFRKAVEGFALPRFGDSCPLWPIFGALSRPMTPIRRRVAQPGQDGARFDCIAISEPIGPPAFDRDPVYRSTMLILPVTGPAASDGEAAEPVGVSCRICPREGCHARREPSILR